MEFKKIKIAIVGPESAGKTTISKELSNHFNATYIEEYARIYLEKNGSKYTYSDLEKLAKKQLELEKGGKSKLLICDTNLLTYKIWSLYKYKKCSSWIINNLNLSTFNLHFICFPDFQWEKDKLRENPSQIERNEIFNLYKKELSLLKLNHITLKESHSKRLNYAINKINSLLKE